MAYLATVTVTRLNERDLHVRVAEIDCNSTDEATIASNDLPRQCRVLRQTSTLSAGTGVTVDPILGRLTNPSGLAVIIENGAPAITIDNAPVGGVPAYTGGTYPYSLFHRSRPNAGADNVITTEYLIREGWVN